MKLLFGNQCDIKSDDQLASEALNEIFTPQSNLYRASAGDESDIDLTTDEEREEANVITFTDEEGSDDVGEGKFISALEDIFSPNTSYETKKEAVADVVEAVAEEVTGDSEKADAIVDMVLGRIEEHIHEDEQSDEYVGSDSDVSVEVADDSADNSEEYEESPIAIGNGDKAAELLAKREAIRVQLEQEKSDNVKTLEEKKRILEQNRDILRRQMALKQQNQYAMAEDPDEAYDQSANEPTWVGEDEGSGSLAADTEYSDSTSNVVSVENTEYDEGCKSEVQECSNTTDAESYDAIKGMDSADVETGKYPEDPDVWTPEVSEAYGEGCGEHHSKWEYINKNK